MTITKVTEHCFEDQLDSLIKSRMTLYDNTLCKQIHFVAVNPPLIPEAPFDIAVARNKDTIIFLRQVQCIYAQASTH